MAEAVGISLGSVQRIWRAHQLQPHRLRSFKRSRDPEFADKLSDILGLYIDPPAHAVVLSIDEKSQIQGLPLARTGALDRTQPGLPLKPGRCQTMTHDYKRHGTTTLFAALSMLDGSVIGRCMQRHRHLEFIRFLNAVERQVAAGKPIHVVLDNYATHKHPKSLPSRKRGAGLARPPSALDLPLHPNLGLLAQRRRKLLLQTDPPAHPPRRVSLDRRPADRHQRLSRRAQRQPQALCVDPIRRCHPRKTRPLPRTFCLNQSARPCTDLLPIRPANLPSPPLWGLVRGEGGDPSRPRRRELGGGSGAWHPPPHPEPLRPGGGEGHQRDSGIGDVCMPQPEAEAQGK
jgi:hypothetical protein